MNNDILTNSDIDLLMKGLSALKDVSMKDAILKTIMTAAVSGEASNFLERATAAMDEAQRKADREEEPIILLKVKLIHLRDRATLAEATDILKGDAIDER